MTTSIKSGKSMTKEIRWLLGSWLDIENAAIKIFGERGRIMAILNRPTTLKSLGGCKSLLEQAGFNVDRVTSMTQQNQTIKGLRLAMFTICEWIEADVCPNFLKEDACNEVDCELKHELPILLH